jgi:excisionase family DNA binding protein
MKKMKFVYIDRPMEPMIGSIEAAAYLGFSVGLVRRMAKDGRLPTIAFPLKGGKTLYRFQVSALQEHLAALRRRPVLEESAVPEEEILALRAS